jgi:hypothetical protein
MYGGGVKEKRQRRFPKAHWRGWRTRGRVRTCASALKLPQSTFVLPEQKYYISRFSAARSHR